MSEESWKRVQSLLKENLSKPSYETWIRQIQFLSFKNGELTLIVSNSAWLKNDCSQKIQETAEKVFGEPVTLKVKIRSIYKKDRELEEKDSNLGKTIPRGIILSDPPGVFETIEQGKKRIEKQQLKEKQIRQKIRRYLYVVLIIIGAIFVILKR